MISKCRELYTLIVEKMRSTIPGIIPAFSISDWELARRNDSKKFTLQFNFTRVGSIYSKNMGYDPKSWSISGISSKPGNSRFYQTVDGDPISTCYFNSSNLLIPRNS